MYEQYMYFFYMSKEFLYYIYFILSFMFVCSIYPFVILNIGNVKVLVFFHMPYLLKIFYSFFFFSISTKI